MRREKLDVLLLSDVHTASSGRFNTSHTTVALEEFVMIDGKMSSIILSPAAQAARRETGYGRYWQDGGCRSVDRWGEMEIRVRLCSRQSETSMGERFVLGKSTALA